MSLYSMGEETGLEREHLAKLFLKPDGRLIPRGEEAHPHRCARFSPRLPEMDFTSACHFLTDHYPLSVLSNTFHVVTLSGQKRKHKLN